VLRWLGHLNSRAALALSARVALALNPCAAVTVMPDSGRFAFLRVSAFSVAQRLPKRLPAGNATDSASDFVSLVSSGRAATDTVALRTIDVICGTVRMWNIWSI